MTTHPMKQGTFQVTSGYGPRWGTFHAGLDFAAPIGTPIYAPADGYVVEGKERPQGSVSGFGSWIWLDCQQAVGKDFIFGHVHHPGILVRAGERVRAGQQIGVVGNEGQSTGPHLHFEVWGPPGRSGGRHEDPAAFLRGAVDPVPSVSPPPPSKGTSMTVLDWTNRFVFGNPRATSNIRFVCVHVTVNAPGTPAENVANYQIRTQTGSYHELVDANARVLIENTDDWLTWSAGPTGNLRGLHRSFVMQGTESSAEWRKYDAMLRAGAKRDAAWAKRYGIPIRKLTSAQLRAGEKGFCGHEDVSYAWGESDHVDPGPGFPWDYYLQLVREYQNPQTTKENDLTPEQDRLLRETHSMTKDIHRELIQKYPSRSAFRSHDKPIDTLAGMILNADARIHELWTVFLSEKLGVKPTEVPTAIQKLVGGK